MNEKYRTKLIIPKNIAIFIHYRIKSINGDIEEQDLRINNRVAILL